MPRVDWRQGVALVQMKSGARDAEVGGTALKCAALRPLLETATTAARPLHHRDDGGAPLFLHPAAAVLRAAAAFAM